MLCYGLRILKCPRNILGLVLPRSYVPVGAHLLDKKLYMVMLARTTCIYADTALTPSLLDQVLDQVTDNLTNSKHVSLLQQYRVILHVCE